MTNVARCTRYCLFQNSNKIGQSKIIEGDEDEEKRKNNNNNNNNERTPKPKQKTTTKRTQIKINKKEKKCDVFSFLERLFSKE